MNVLVQYAKGNISKYMIEDLLKGDEDYLQKYPFYQKTNAPPEGLYLADIKYNLDEIIVKTWYQFLISLN